MPMLAGSLYSSKLKCQRARNQPPSVAKISSSRRTSSGASCSVEREEAIRAIHVCPQAAFQRLSGDSTPTRQLGLPDQDLGARDWMGAELRRTGRCQTNRGPLLEIARVLEVGAAASDVHVHELAIWHGDRLAWLEATA